MESQWCSRCDGACQILESPWVVICKATQTVVSEASAVSHPSVWYNVLECGLDPWR